MCSHVNEIFFIFLVFLVFFFFLHFVSVLLWAHKLLSNETFCLRFSSYESRIGLLANLCVWKDLLLHLLTQFVCFFFHHYILHLRDCWWSNKWALSFFFFFSLFLVDSLSGESKSWYSVKNQLIRGRVKKEPEMGVVKSLARR